MLSTGKTTLFTLLLLLAVALSACAFKTGPGKRQNKNQPTTLKKGIPVLGRRILNNIAEKKALILLEPFKEATLYDEIKASAEIERLLLGLGSRKKYTGIRLISTADASDRELEQADYILKGVISYSPWPEHPTQKYYRILASLADRKTGTLTARASIWVYSVPYGKLELPVITADPTAKRKVTEIINKQKISVKDIKTDARIAKAKAAYRRGQYPEVLQILEQLITSSGKGVLDAYRMLYLASLKINDFSAAETAFFNMIKLGFKNTYKMPLLFLFESNSTEFAPNRVQEYDIWIRQLVAYLQENEKNVCTSSATQASRGNSNIIWRFQETEPHISKTGWFRNQPLLSSASASRWKEKEKQPQKTAANRTAIKI